MYKDDACGVVGFAPQVHHGWCFILPILFATIRMDENAPREFEKNLKHVNPTCATDNRKVNGIGVWGSKLSNGVGVG